MLPARPLRVAKIAPSDGLERGRQFYYWRLRDVLHFCGARYSSELGATH